MGLKKHGITSETIKNMILGAGVIYKNLKYEKPSNGWTGTPLGATSGGLKFNYEAQWLDVEVDGASLLKKRITDVFFITKDFVNGARPPFCFTGAGENTISFKSFCNFIH